MYISEFNNVPINFIEENSSDGERCVWGAGVKIKMCYNVYKQLIIILKKDIKNKFSKTLFCFITVEKFMQTVKCVW